MESTRELSPTNRREGMELFFALALFAVLGLLGIGGPALVSLAEQAFK